MKILKLTAEQLREVLDYDPWTGGFTWRKAISSHVVVGQLAGGPKPPKNYIWIRIDGQGHYAHRLAWLWMTGQWPIADVDHENLKHDDNRWENLRSASRSENRCNTGLYRNSASGLKGVYFNQARGKWHARITKDGRTRSLGYFQTAIDAHHAYAAAAGVVHGSFSRTA